MRSLLPLALLCALAACGGRVALKPPAGKALPPRAYGATSTPGVDALLEATSQARPARNAELLTRSDARSDDPFDLPPGANPAKVPMPPATPVPATAAAAAAAQH